MSASASASASGFTGGSGNGQYQLYNQRATITFCECAESHHTLDQLGEKAEEGLTMDELRAAKASLEAKDIVCELVDLTRAGHEAGVLVIRDGVRHLTGHKQQRLMKEVTGLRYDTKMVHYKKVVEKRARHCNVMGDEDREPDYEKGQGTVVAFSHAPIMSRLREGLPEHFGEKARTLYAEVNKYPSKPDGTVEGGIGLHGDAERRIVIAARLGDIKRIPAAGFPLVYIWFKESKQISDPIYINLLPGDMYAMSDKAVGHDWKLRKVATLRHAAGAAKYLEPKAKAKRSAVAAGAYDDGGVAAATTSDGKAKTPKAKTTRQTTRSSGGKRSLKLQLKKK
eukprot:m.4962 g.4962  ORF g.4962 m.4962 type:complete len:339 (-) comp4739_c0_seq1:434-1450(-)